MTFLEKLKKLIGVEPGTALAPMISYNSAIFLSGGAFYIIGNYFLVFLTKVEGLSAQQYSIVFMFAMICDAITDPVMGIVTDRTRHRNGRHRPYIKWGIAPAAITFFMLWNSFGISSRGNTTVTMIYYIIVYMAFRTAYTFVIVPHTAMLPEIAPGYSLRTQYNAVKTIMDAVASYSSFLVSALFFGLFETEEFGPQSRTKFTWMSIVLALWVSLPLIYTYCGTKERSSLGDPVDPFDFKSFVERYRNIIMNKSFRIYFMFSFFTMLSSCFVSQTSYYFLQNIAQQEKNYNMMTTISGIAEAVGFFPAYFFSIKRTKQLPAKVFIPVAICALSIAFTVSPSSPAVMMYIVNFLYGLGLAGMASVQSNIFPDITDVDEMITGQRREGTISTFSTFVKKFVNGFASLGVGGLLSLFGFDTQKTAAMQTATALRGLKITYTCVPVFFLLCSIAVIFTYRMTKENHALIKRVIKEKHETGTVNISEEDKSVLERISGRKYEEMWIGSN